jgi:uncharacterized protein YndB with AHSA1/START domain
MAGSGTNDQPKPQDKGEMSSVPCVTFVRLLPGPIERVWEYLTDPARLPSWFGEVASIEPRRGGAVRLVNGHIRGVVTQWQPPRRLIYTWNVFDPNDPIRRSSWNRAAMACC